MLPCVTRWCRCQADGRGVRAGSGGADPGRKSALVARPARQQFSGEGRDFECHRRQLYAGVAQQLVAHRRSRESSARQAWVVSQLQLRTPLQRTKQNSSGQMWERVIDPVGPEGVQGHGMCRSPIATQKDLGASATLMEHALSHAQEHLLSSALSHVHSTAS